MRAPQGAGACWTKFRNPPKRTCFRWETVEMAWKCQGLGFECRPRLCQNPFENGGGLGPAIFENERRGGGLIALRSPKFQPYISFIRCFIRLFCFFRDLLLFGFRGDALRGRICMRADVLSILTLLSFGDFYAPAWDRPLRGCKTCCCQGKPAEFQNNNFLQLSCYMECCQLVCPAVSCGILTRQAKRSQTRIHANSFFWCWSNKIWGDVTGNFGSIVSGCCLIISGLVPLMLSLLSKQKNNPDNKNFDPELPITRPLIFWTGHACGLEFRSIKTCRQLPRYTVFCFSLNLIDDSWVCTLLLRKLLSAVCFANANL